MAKLLYKGTVGKAFIQGNSWQICYPREQLAKLLYKVTVGKAFIQGNSWQSCNLRQRLANFCIKETVVSSFLPFSSDEKKGVDRSSTVIARDVNEGKLRRLVLVNYVELPQLNNLIV